jgi:alpha-beta hydrolase superfamily lysophospholipase
MSRIAHYPASLRDRSRLVRLARTPALVVRPETTTALAPYLIWLHGRTASKELESARYQRVSRAGIGICALDLPGHGERLDPAYQEPDALPRLLAEMLEELDPAIDALANEPGVDRKRLALGGMSAGGMVALRRLCDPHTFEAALVEATAGDFSRAGEERHRDARLRGLDPMQHLSGWRDLPLLALHSEADELVPVAAIRSFIEALPPGHARLVTWERTGAPREHLGFGKVAAEARNVGVDFLAEHLLR